MHDELNAIRRLYGETGTEGPPPDPQAASEATALAQMKAALDALPPQRPDASVIDAVVAAAGEAARASALAPIRVVYGEQPEPLASEDTEVSEQAEVERVALAEMKAALEALPSQRPDASVIDAVVSAAGEAAQATALAPVRVAYDEEPEPLVSARAETEAAALAEMKSALDRLPRQRPDAYVVDAVVAAAARPSQPASGVPAPDRAPSSRAADRPARRATRRRVATVLSAVFAVVLVFGGGLWLNDEAAAPEQFAAADRAEAEEQVADAAPPQAPAEESVVNESIAEATPAAAPPPEVAASLAAASRTQAAPRGGADGAASADRGTESAAPTQARTASAGDLLLASEADLPLADGDEELRLLYLRLREMQAAQAGLGWDATPVSLGAAPDSTPAATGWMQVRVQR